ncbi:3'(2'),5'-bisphosphate nucleotidase CysQ family protein [Niabella ginsengisoli]|uniref:3'(2'),5'-bisphosphate nucleotidase CysQ family protein n=1 Tax=Niabella ginsengisoli TaxID=522298 RepID=UPI0021D47701|nr:3'(2'),5'-bisphosphate nucleotidase CysQ [Niabella ginsengisoli]
MITYINSLLNIVKEAGDAIMEIYNADNIDVSYKDDRSPLTAADHAAHNIIAKGLQQIAPHIPIISEEGENSTRLDQAETFWCVDPLDGTKEFIKKNGEFTVNVALITNQLPVLGVVYAPALATCYYGANDYGSFKKQVTKRQ